MRVGYSGQSCGSGRAGLGSSSAPDAVTGLVKAVVVPTVLTYFPWIARVTHVQGPGAGAAVTAAGTYADFLKIAAPHASATWLSPLAPARRLPRECTRSCTLISVLWRKGWGWVCGIGARDSARLQTRSLLEINHTGTLGDRAEIARERVIPDSREKTILCSRAQPGWTMAD